MKRNPVAAAMACAILLAGCQIKTSNPLSEAEAAKIADETQQAWISMDVGKIEGRYAKDVVAFDPVVAPLASDWQAFHKLQEGFVAMKFDAIAVPDRAIQVLDADTFVVCGTGALTSTEGALKQVSMRFTNVYQRQQEGDWLIVNEHVSLRPVETG